MQRQPARCTFYRRTLVNVFESEISHPLTLTFTFLLSDAFSLTTNICWVNPDKWGNGVELSLSMQRVDRIEWINMKGLGSTWPCICGCHCCGCCGTITLLIWARENRSIGGHWRSQMGQTETHPNVCSENGYPLGPYLALYILQLRTQYLVGPQKILLT